LKQGHFIFLATDKSGSSQYKNVLAALKNDTANPKSAAKLAWTCSIPGVRLYALIRDFISGQLTLRHASLVYTTLLSLCRLLAPLFDVEALASHQKWAVLYRSSSPRGPTKD